MPVAIINYTGKNNGQKIHTKKQVLMVKELQRMVKLQLPTVENCNIRDRHSLDDNQTLKRRRHIKNKKITITKAGVADTAELSAALNANGNNDSLNSEFFLVYSIWLS